MRRRDYLRLFEAKNKQIPTIITGYNIITVGLNSEMITLTVTITVSTAKLPALSVTITV